MSTSQAIAVTSYQVFSVGALPSPWVPPSSCVSTTTSFDGQLWLGTIGALGTDPACYPPQTTRVQLGAQVTATPTPTLSARDVGNAIDLYSPGICPYGWNYVASFVTTLAEAASTSARTVSIASSGSEATTYFCCPGGFSAGERGFEPVTQTVGPSPTIFIDYLSCTMQQTALVTNIWNLETASEWPSAQPTNMKLYSLTNQAGNTAIEDVACTTWTVFASGIAVAWSPADTVINDILANGSYAYINNGLFSGLPDFPPPYPTPNIRPTSCGTPGSSASPIHGAVAVAIGAGVVVLLVACCCVVCCRAGRSRRAAQARMRRTGAMPMPMPMPVGAGAGGRRWKQHDDQIPLNAVGPAPNPAYVPGLQQPFGRYEPMRDFGDDRPPAYDDALLTDDADLHAAGGMEPGRVEDEHGYGEFGRV